MPEKKLVTQSETDFLDVIQISDPHIDADCEARFVNVDTAMTLANVIDEINHNEAPDLVLLTGDLVNKVSKPSYRRLLQILHTSPYSIYCLPGNHDEPQIMESELNTGNTSTKKVLYSQHWDLVLLDSVVANSQSGYLSSRELEFLEQQLVRTGDKPVLVALHHHPLPVNSSWMDRMMLDNPEDFFKVLDRFPQVRAVLCGHIHNAFSLKRRGTLLLGCPSTCVQFNLEQESTKIIDKPPAYRRLKLCKNGEIESIIRWLE